VVLSVGPLLLLLGRVHRHVRTEEESRCEMGTLGKARPT
jgi:hypothetical protein